MVLPKHLRAVSAALVLAGLAPSQQCLDTSYAGTLSTGLDAAAYVDLSVRVPVILHAIRFNFDQAPGLPAGLVVHGCPDSYVANTRNAAAWTQLAVDDGTALCAGPGLGTTIPLQNPIQLAAGKHGLCFATQRSVTMRFALGAGSFADAVLTLHSGATQATPFIGNAPAPRTWNGTLCYTVAPGLHPDFDAAPRVGASPLSVTFTDRSHSSDPAGIASWSWDFEDDGTPDAFVPNPTHVYRAPGIFSVRLTVTDALHGTRSRTLPDLVSVDPVDANFTASPRSGAVPLTVHFTDTSAGFVDTWAWDFDGDGLTDSTQQHPSWQYVNPGRYTVRLRSGNAGQADSETKLNFVFVSGPPVDPGPPEILQYQFNEARGALVANTATGPLAPAFGTVSDGGVAPVPNPHWQADPARAGWRGNEPGFGCLGVDDVAPFENRVDTAWPLVLSGSHTIAFWSRAVAPPSTLGVYAFGAKDASARALVTGSVLSLRNWGTLGNTALDSATDPDATSQWTHWALVVDDQLGTAQWFVDGMPDGEMRIYPAGTFQVSAGALLVGGWMNASTLHWTRRFELDDFRVYGRALSPQELLGCMVKEQAAASTFGPGCPGSTGVPVIGSAHGRPRLGNQAFGITVAGVEPGAPIALLLGLHVRAGNLPLDLAFLLGRGCLAETLPGLGAPVLGVGPSASLALGIPLDQALAGAHVYAQALVFGVPGAASAGLDLSLQL